MSEHEMVELVELGEVSEETKTSNVFNLQNDAGTVSPNIYKRPQG